MATKQTVIRKGLTILGNLSSGIGDPVLTRDAADKSVGTINPIDPSSYLTTALTNGYILIGNGSNLATPVLPTGAITFSNTGVSSIAADVITNNNINSAAAIAYSKLNLTLQIKNADIAVAAAITRTKLATGNVNRILINDASGIFTENTAITANRVLISDANGLPIHSTTTTTTLGFLDISSSLTTLLSNKLSFSSALTPATGDTIIYTGGVWTRLPIGTAGQVLTVTGGVPAWGAATANGLPTGGTAGQYLNKIDGTNYNTQWSTLSVSSLTGVTANTADVNLLTGLAAFGITTAKLQFLNGLSSDVQAQLNAITLRSPSLTANYLWVGTIGGNALPLAPGTNGQVLSISGGNVAWTSLLTTGHVIQDSVPTSFTQRTNLKFVGLTVTDDPGNNATVVTNAGSWLLASGGTLTGTNTITSNTANQLLFSGTWTATANNQNHVEFAGTFTSRNTASDTLFGYVFDPTLTRNVGNPATQTAYAVYINPTFNNTFSANYALGVTKPIWLTAGGINWEIGPGVGSLSGGNNDFGFNAIGSTGWGFSQNGTPKVYYSNIGNFQVNSTLLSGTLGNYTIWSASFGAVVADAAKLYVRQANLSTGWIPTLRIDPGAHTAITNTLENINQDFQTATQTWAGGGTVATQRSTYFRGITLAGASAQTFTNAYTVYIDNPIAGTNATITNAISLGVGSAFLANNTTKTIASFVGTNATGSGGYNISLGNTAILADTVLLESAGYGAPYYFSLRTTGTGRGIIFGGQGVNVSGAILGDQPFAFYTSGNVRIGSYALASADLAKFYILQSNLSASWIPATRIDAAAHTAITAASEQSNIILNSANANASFSSGASLSAGTASKTWADGTVVTQRDIYVRGITYNKTTTSATFTRAYSVYIDAPSAGAGVTITNNWALGLNGNFVASGQALIGGTAITNASTILDLQSATQALKLTTAASASIASPSAGMLTSDAGNLKYYNGASWVTVGVAGGGITNSAANTELMMSNGTNAVSSKLFVPSSGDLTFGDTGLAGSVRTLTASGSAANVDINIITKGTAVMRLQANAILMYDPAVPTTSVQFSSTGIVNIYTAGAVAAFSITSANGHAASVTGGDFNLKSGNGYTVGNNAAGNINISSGVPNGSGAEGAVNVQSRSTGKLGFYNVAAITRPTTAVAAAAFVANAGTAVNDASTFGGYTIKQIVQALQNLGLLT